jgi:hypothetical protein
MVTFVSNFNTCFDDVLDKLQRDEPVFVSRIGGSDTDAVVDYLRIKETAPDGVAAHAAKYIPMVSKFNGFYDRSSSLRVYLNYCDELVRAYESSETLFLCNYQLLSLFFKDVLNPVFFKEDFENKKYYRALIERIRARVPALRCYPYQFIEKMVFDDHTLFRAFSTALVGKKVLVASPFSRSIAENFPRRHSFFRKSYVYPEFDLKLLDTPITYAGLPSELYPHEDWFATTDSLREELSRLDFDVALLCCGSYAMPLGLHIERELGRKAVYVGGVLQLFFGIMGRRYENPFFLDQINAENFIYPLERDRYLKSVDIREDTAKEAFGAYF